MPVETVVGVQLCLPIGWLQCFDTVDWAQEGDPACKKIECRYIGVSNLTGALYVLEFRLSPPPLLSSLVAVKPIMVF